MPFVAPPELLDPPQQTGGFVAPPETLDNPPETQTSDTGGEGPSFGGTVAREVGRSALPGYLAYLAGPAAYAGASELAPLTGGWSYAVPLVASAIAGLGTFMGARKLQDVAANQFVPDSFLGSQSAEQDVQAHPYGTMLGGFLAMGRPGISTLAKVGNGVLTTAGRAELAAAINAVKTGGTATAEQMELLNHVAHLGTNAGIGAGMGIAEGQSPGDIALNTAGLALFNKGWLPHANVAQSIQDAQAAAAKPPHPLVVEGANQSQDLRESAQTADPKTAAILNSAADAVEKSTEDFEHKNELDNLAASVAPPPEAEVTEPPAEELPVAAPTEPEVAPQEEIAPPVAETAPVEEAPTGQEIAPVEEQPTEVAPEQGQQPPQDQDVIDERVGQRLLDDPQYNQHFENGQIAEANARRAEIAQEEGGKVQQELSGGKPPIEDETPEVKAQQDKEALSNLNEWLGKIQHRGGAVISLKPSKPIQEFAKTFQKVFGRRVVFVEGKNKKLPLGGVTLRKYPDTIYVDPTSKINSISVIGHEFIDSLANDHDPQIRQLHGELVNALREHFDKTELFQDYLNDLRKSHGLGLVDTETAEHEMAANYVGDRILDPKFLKELSNTNPSLFEKLGNIIREWLAKVKSAFTKYKGEGWVNDIAQADKAVQKLLTEVAQRKADSAQELGTPARGKDFMMRTEREIRGRPVNDQWYADIDALNAFEKDFMAMAMPERMAAARNLFGSTDNFRRAYDNWRRAGGDELFQKKIYQGMPRSEIEGERLHEFVRDAILGNLNTAQPEARLSTDEPVESPHMITSENEPTAPDIDYEDLHKSFELKDKPFTFDGRTQPLEKWAREMGASEDESGLKKYPKEIKMAVAELLATGKNPSAKDLWKAVKRWRSNTSFQEEDFGGAKSRQMARDDEDAVFQNYLDTGKTAAAKEMLEKRAANEGVPVPALKMKQGGNDVPFNTRFETRNGARYSTDEPIGIHEAEREKVRAEYGMAAETKTPTSMEAIHSEADKRIAADPTAPRKLIEEMQTNPRQLDAVEVSMIAKEQRRLINGIDATVDGAKNGDAEAILRGAPLIDELDALHQVAAKNGTGWGRAGRTMQDEINKDYTVEGMMKRTRRTSPTGEVSPEQEAAIKRTYDEIDIRRRGIEAAEKQSVKETTEALKEEEKGFTHTDWWERGKESMDTETRALAEKLEDGIREADLIRQEIARMEAAAGARFSLDPQELEGRVKGKSLEELKARLEALDKQNAETLKAMGKATTKSRTTAEARDTVERAKKSITKRATRPKAVITEESLNKALEPAKGKTIADIPHSLLDKIARFHVQQGAVDEPDLTERVRKTLEPIIPGVTGDEVRGALSRYGQATFPSQAHVEKTLRGLKGEMLQLEKIRDVSEKLQAAQRTGQQRDKPTARARELQKQLSRMMRDLGIESNDPKRLAGNRQAIISRLNNEVEELTRIIEGKAKPQKPNEPAKYTPEMETLAKHRDEIKAYVKDLTGPSPEHEWNEKAQKAAKASEEAWKARIKNQEFEEKAKPSVEATDATKQAREAAAKAKEEFETLRDQIRPDIQQEKDIQRLIKAKQASIDEYKRRIDEQDFTPREKSQEQVDRRVQALQTEQERIRKEFQDKLRKDTLANRDKWQKFWDDWVVKLKRGFVLSSPVSMFKLAAAALSRGATHAAEELTGGAWGRVLPEQLIRQAKLEGGGFNSKFFANAMAKASTDGLQDAKDTIRTGRSNLDVKFGKAGHDNDWSSWIGRLHAAVKAPVKRFLYEHALSKLNAAYGRDGVDTSDPAVQLRLEAQAFKAAERGIFLQDNVVSSAWNAAAGYLGGQKGTAGPAIARAMRVLLPIVKVPTNIIAESAQMAYGVPVGLTKLAKAWHAGLDNLQPEQADIIMRNLKKGSIGAALMSLGFFAAGNVGGYFSGDDKRKAGDVKAGGFRIFGQDVPTWLTHAPAFEALQMGATLRRALGHGQGLSDAALASAIGLAEETPFLNEMMRTKDMQTAKGRSQFFGELAKSNVEPALLQKLAEWTDRERPLQATDLLTGEGTQKRAPESFGDVLKTGVPGLREQVAPKIDKPLTGTGIMLPGGLDFAAPRKGDLLKKNPSMSDTQFKGYSDVRGENIRRQLSASMAALRAMSPEEQKKEVATINAEATQEAKQRSHLK